MSSPNRKPSASQYITVEWLATLVSMPLVKAINHPAGLLFGATKVVSKVIGFLALQKQTSPSVCVWPRRMERGGKRSLGQGGTFSWLKTNSLFPLRGKHSFTFNRFCDIFFSLFFEPHFFPSWRVFVTLILKRSVTSANSGLQQVLRWPHHFIICHLNRLNDSLDIHYKSVYTHIRSHILLAGKHTWITYFTLWTKYIY